MNDLVNCLRKWSRLEAIAPGSLAEAADEIESLQARLDVAAGMLDASHAMLKDAFGDECDEFDHECAGCQAWRLIRRIEAFLTPDSTWTK